MTLPRHTHTHIQTSYHDRYPSWAAIPWRVKRRFFSTWLLLIFLGTSLALVSAVLNLVERKNYAPSLLSHKVWKNRKNDPCASECVRST